MDARRFDHLATAMMTQPARRRVRLVLAALPLLGGLAGLLDPEDSTAKDRRRRRKGRHKRRKDPGSRKGKQGCKPQGKGKVCAGTCGPVKNRQTCGKTVDCGPCPCTPACGACQTCDPATLTCVATCAADACCAGGCVDLETNAQHCGACGNACGKGQVCQSGVCGVACGGDFCPASTEICVGGVCQECTVRCTGSPEACGEGLQEALEDDSLATVSVCSGTYQGGFTIGRTVTVRGAGAGQTILDGNTTMQVLAITATVPVTLQALTITRGTHTVGGGGIYNEGALTLIDAELAANTSTGSGGGGGGGAIRSFNALTLRNTLVRGNTTTEHGGAIRIDGATLILEDGSSIEENTAEFTGGGISAATGAVTLEQGSRVFKNHAGSHGGGIFIQIETLLTLEDGSSIEANSAGNGGGGINAAFSTVTLKTGSRVTHNTAESGGALANGASMVTIEEGVLICGNSSPQCGGFAVTGSCPTSAPCP